MMKNRILTVAALGALAFTAACSTDFAVPDLNNPGLEQLEGGDPTRSAVVDATQGLLIGSRTAVSNQSGYVSHLGMLGRESLTFDNSDPRYFDEILAGLLNPGNGAFGGSGWGPRYTNIRNANIVLNSLENASGFTAAELEGIRGFAKTIQALDFLMVTNMRGSNGAALDVNRPLGDDPAPFVSEDQMLQGVVTLLSEAATHLGAAGSAFAFQLSDGYGDFDDPASFLQFNRALLARVEVYRGDYSAAISALNASFLDLNGDFDLGVYHSYGTGSGDATNGLFQGSDPQIVAHPTVWTDAPLKGNGDRDDRVTSKVQALSPTKSDPRGVTSDVRFIHYPSLSASTPIIRNEELILLWAEAQYFAGNPGQALTAINEVRTRSGGLDPAVAPANDTEFVDLLLGERRWSLLFEGGHRWLDARRFGRLGDLPLDRPTDLIPTAFPIPRNECIARELSVPCSV